MRLISARCCSSLSLYDSLFSWTLTRSSQNQTLSSKHVTQLIISRHKVAFRLCALVTFSCDLFVKWTYIGCIERVHSIILPLDWNFDRRDNKYNKYKTYLFTCIFVYNLKHQNVFLHVVDALSLWPTNCFAHNFYRRGHERKLIFEAVKKKKRKDKNFETRDEDVHYHFLYQISRSFARCKMGMRGLLRLLTAYRNHAIKYVSLAYRALALARFRKYARKYARKCRLARAIRIL